jgi:sugar lactone lactonase YvrE
MTFNTLPKFAGAFFNWLSRIACGLLLMLAFNSTTLAVDLLYVSLDDNSIATYDTTGGVGSTIKGTKATFASTNLNNPTGLAFDTSGNLYVANFLGNTISKFNSSGGYVSNISGLSGPVGLAFDSTGILYVASGINTIGKFNASDTYIGSISDPNLNSPTGLAFDISGNLYASCYNTTISKFNSSGTYVSSINSHLYNPNGLAFDSSGNLYVANTAIYSIRKFNALGGYTGSIDDPTNSSYLNGPVGLTFDSLGNLYVANWLGYMVSKFDSSGNFLTSWSTYPAAPFYLAFRPIPVPEPSTYILAAIAAGVMAYLARRRKARIA